MLTKHLSGLVTQPISGKDVLIQGIAIDSRKVGKDHLFCAYHGDTSDAHQFIAQAVASGACAVALEDAQYLDQYPVSYVQIANLRAETGFIASRFYDFPSRKLRVVGVTGTNGKTSVTHYIEQLLAQLEQSCAIIGTLGIRYNGQMQSTANTTPDAVTLQQQFAEMHQQGVACVAMEVSSHALAQGRCNGVVFEGAVFTNLSHDHLDYHATLDAYFAAKASLFTRDELQWAVLNRDDARFESLSQTIPSAVRQISYSIHNAQADVSLRNVHYQHGIYQAELMLDGQAYPLSCALQGEFNLSNLLASVAALYAMKLDVQAVVQAVSQLRPVAGRMQAVANNNGITALVDYAHTPDALANVLRNARPLAEGQLIVVFGCGGDRDRGKRPMMAQIAERYADSVIVTADNPRTENQGQIFSDMVAGFSKQKHQLIADRREAITAAVALAQPGDVLVLAGKGHEQYQIIGDQQLPFDDAAVLQEALNNEVASC